MARVNVNTASEAELGTVPGIDAAVATKIVQERPYHSLQDLYTKNVAPPRELNSFIHLLTVADDFEETILVDTVLPLKSRNHPSMSLVGYTVTTSFFVRRTQTDGTAATTLQRTDAAVRWDGTAEILLPAGLDILGEIKVDVRAPIGAVVHTHLYPSAADFVNKDLAPLEFDTTLPTTPIPGSPGPPTLLKGRLLDLVGTYRTQDVQLIFLASDQSNAKFEECLPVGVAVTERDGYFVAPYPNVPAATIFVLAGIPGLAPQPLEPADDGRFPQTALIVIDASAAGGGGAGADSGCGDLDLFGEARVLDEFTFFTVVRTTEPDVKRLVLEQDEEIDLEDVIKTAPSPWQSNLREAIPRGATLAAAPTSRALTSAGAGIYIPEGLKGLRIRSSVLRDFTAVHRVVTPDNIEELIQMNEAAKVRTSIFLQPRLFPGRFEPSSSRSVDWDDEPTLYQATTIAHGHLLQYRQEWLADGYSLGDLLYSLPLAPGQKKQIVIYDWERRESASKSESLDYQEALTNTLSRDRDINDIANAMVSEAITARSSSDVSGWGVGGGIGAILPIEVPIGALFGGGGGAGSASSTAQQQATRQTSASSLQQLRDKTVQTANAIRSQRATVIQTATQGERFQVQSESVANYNHCHALTIEYFEVLRHFKIQIRLADVRECLFVPLLITQFDINKALRWENTLNRFLLNRTLRKGFPALGRIRDRYEGSDLPVGSFAEGTVEFLDGDLFLEFRIARPADKEGDVFEAANWIWMNRLLPFISPMEFHAQYIKVAQQKDKIFVDQLGPTIAETFCRGLKMFAITNTGEVELPIDPTLVSEFRHKERLYVSLRMANNMPPIQRDQIRSIRISNRDRDGRLLSDLLPGTTKVIVRSGTMRYRTKHFSGTLFRDAAINNDLTASDDVRIYSPLSTEELRRPRNEDVEAANRLLQHLNEHLEYYHKALWMSMSAERRFLLLDGIYAPEFTDPLTGQTVRRSVASVVENRVVGIVGNSLVMPVAPGLNLDPNFSLTKTDAETGRPTGELHELIEFYQHQPPEPLHVTVPTKGVYAEALMGKCNSCEEKDESRFWRWEESPIPDDPTSIQPILAPTPTVTRPDLEVKDFPSPIVNVQNAPAAPDPQGYAALVQLLSNPELFRDLTGLTENQRNALGAMQRSLQTAEFFGGKAAELTQAAATMRMIQEANRKGVLSNESAKELSDKTVRSHVPKSATEEASEVEEKMKTIQQAMSTGAIDSGEASALQKALLQNFIGKPAPGGIPTSKIEDLMTLASTGNTALTMTEAAGGQLSIQPASTSATPAGGAGTTTPAPGTTLPHMAFKPILLERLDPATNTMVPGVVPATPDALATPFFNAKTVGVARDPTLQPLLTGLINSKPAYKNAGTNLAVALVDLSGANKFQPKYAGHNDLINMYGASVLKITGMLGAYQLLAEANELLKANPSIPDVAGLATELKAAWSNAGIASKHHPHAAKILEFNAGSPPTASLHPDLLARFDDLSHGNQNGSTAILLLKFPYLGSTLLAHGLYSPANKGGLWVRKGYGGITYRGKQYADSVWPAKENPFPSHSVHNMNAVCAAQFYTLAAQRRMIDTTTSKAVLQHLGNDGCYAAIDTADIDNMNNNGELATKCGIFDGFIHETLHFKETATLREFVVVIMTQNNHSGVIKQLFKDIVALVP